MKNNFKKDLVLYSKLLNKNNLSPIRSGNISVRYKKNEYDGFFITPSGVRNEKVSLKNIVFVDMNGLFTHPTNKPSSEWKFHMDIYKKKETKAIVHCHSKYAVVLATHQILIPSFHYMVALAGGINIKCAKYATYGTQELSNNILLALKDRKACLISNHGQVSIGESLLNAFELAQEIEYLSELYYKSILLGSPKLLSKKNMLDVINKISTYKNSSS